MRIITQSTDFGTNSGCPRIRKSQPIQYTHYLYPGRILAKCSRELLRFRLNRVAYEARSCATAGRLTTTLLSGPTLPSCTRCPCILLATSLPIHPPIHAPLKTPPGDRLPLLRINSSHLNGETNSRPHHRRGHDWRLACPSLENPRYRLQYLRA